jgi:hypothetical protein
VRRSIPTIATDIGSIDDCAAQLHASRTGLTTSVVRCAFAAAVLLILAGVYAEGAGASTRCGSFLADQKANRITVFRTGKLKCSRAVKIVKQFRLYKRYTGSDEPYGVKGYPGWRCFEGAGGGSCSKGRRTASWQVRVSSAPPVRKEAD